MLIFRKATMEDAAEAAWVHCRSWIAAYTGVIPDDFLLGKIPTWPARWRDNFAGEHNCHLALLDGKIVGVCVPAPPDDEDLAEYFEIRAFYLDPDCFRQGIGRKFMDYAFDLARAQNYPGVLLYVLEENDRARRFYEACGFVYDGGRKTLDLGKPLENIRYVLTF